MRGDKTSATRHRLHGDRKNADVGGTWLENTYPDCRVDTPNHFYSFSFAPNHDWSRYFSPRDELYEYFRGCADQFGLRAHIRFNSQVEAASWDEGAQNWQVTVRSGDSIKEERANIVISAVGQLNRPQWPRIDGMDNFTGELFSFGALARRGRSTRQNASQ